MIRTQSEDAIPLCCIPPQSCSHTRHISPQGTRAVVAGRLPHAGYARAMHL